LKLFGFEFLRVPKPYENNPISNSAISFVEKNTEDTAASVAASTSFGTYVDIQGTIKTEAELITKYRDMLIQPEIVNAIDEVVNEAISTDEEFVVKIDLDHLPFDDSAKEQINEEFQFLLKLLDFNSQAYNIFKRWYVDGRIYYDIVIDNKNPDLGIMELRYIDPRKIREIKEVKRKKIKEVGDTQNISEVSTVKNNYYLYNEKGFGGTNKADTGLQGAQMGGIRIAKDSVIHVPSGITDSNGTMGLGYLHQAIKILNQLRTIEDSLIIYRLARAPERRVWYVDVGELPKAKAEQYVRDVMISQKNRLIYDADSGQIRDDRKFMTMLEDFWIPRRSDGSGMQVQTLQGGATLGQLDDILYFQKQLYGALNVPIARINPDAPFMLGRTQEVSRDEIKFDKFITRLRQQFSQLFTKTLGRQLILKGMFTIEEWEEYEKDIKYEFARDNHFAELKDQEILSSRAQTSQMLQPYIGLYFSHRWIRREIFKQTDEDINKMTQEIAEEMNDPLYQMASQDEDGENEEEDEEKKPQEGSDKPQETSGKNKSSLRKKYDKSKKIEDAKGIVQSLKGIKNKTPEQEKKLRSAVSVISRAKSEK
jgi:hypothetical protein